MSTGTPSATAQAQEKANTTFDSFTMKNTNISEGPGVKLNDQQKLVVGSVLDLFEGNPTLKHLSLWKRDATFADPLSSAEGFDRYAAQWYGLASLFRPIQIQSHRVVSGGNPIELELTNKYVVAGSVPLLKGKEQTIKSRVLIHVDEADGLRIARVEDRWDDKLPDGAVSEVGRVLLPVAALRAAVRTGVAWGWWAFTNASWWRPFLAFRKLNAVTVPTFVKVPKNEEEDMKMKAERDGRQ
ncbi:hypothetical protein PG999_007614 [Apiospora kogelbergensis]|uniref:SnoaL-like domain-containing protein n=1 Tax=Apiospora kogelbergensis TaxID=1337665 RepID=A0AAW0QLH3_9PEZI